MPDGKTKKDFNITVDPNAILNSGESKYNLNTGSKGYFGNTYFGKSQFDLPNQTSWLDMTQEAIDNNRGERQSNLDKWGVGLSRAALKLGTRTINGVVSPVYGVGSAIKNWDINKIKD